MKKIISILLTIALMMSVGVTALAVDGEAIGEQKQELSGAGSYSHEVLATFVEGGAGETVFSVDIEWSAMNFTYHAAKWAVWDVETLTYSTPQAAYWEGSGIIKIVNRSNTALDITPGYQMEVDFADAKLDFKASDQVITDKLVVASAADTPGSPAVQEIVVTPSGKVDGLAKGGRIGRVTVSVAESEYISVATAELLYTNLVTLADEYRDNGNSDGADALQVNATMLSGYINAYRGDPSDLNQSKLVNGYNAAMETFNEYME